VLCIPSTARRISTRDTPDQGDIVRRLACKLPHAAVVELPEVGHIPTLEAPAKVTAKVLTILRGVP
jgi:pimeloyl-ACP methyl ester carboxylesterase